MAVEKHELIDKTYHGLIHLKRFQIEDGILYYFEHSKSARLRQLQLKVVPGPLRSLVIAACHSSPFGGHSGTQKTLYRIQSRFWWPGMLRDIKTGVQGCAHCNLANAASHEAQM
jgi:hypothetical protein